MSDYISRQDAIKAIDDLPNCYNGYSDTYDKSYIIGALEEVPTADVKPVVRGEWINHCNDMFPNESTMECNQCHHEQPLIIDDTYCPNCGALMNPTQSNTIQHVEVVMCKDCAYNYNPLADCCPMDFMTGDKDFCSWGKRREDEVH